MRSIASSLAVLALVGCGTVGSTKLDVRTSEPVAFSFLDERPAEQRATLKSQEMYGELTRLGDDAITPTGPALLKTWLNEKLSTRLAGATVVLREFSVEILDPAVSIDEGRFGAAMESTPGADPVSGLLARWLIGGIESVKSDKTVGVRISGKIRDREFSGRGGGSFKGRVSEDNINSVITQALDAAVADIELLLAPSGNIPPDSTAKPTDREGG